MNKNNSSKVMMLILVVLFIVIVCMLVHLLVVPNVTHKKTVAWEYVNVRDSPYGQIIGVLHKGETIGLTGRSQSVFYGDYKTWVQIVYEGERAWVAYSSLK